MARTSSIPFGWSWVGGVFDVGSSCQWRNASFCLLKNVNFKVSSMARRFSMHPGSRIRKYPRRFIYQPSEMVKHLPWFHGCPLKVLLVDRTSTGPFDMLLLGRGSTNRRGVLSSFLGYPNLWRWTELVITFCAVPSYIYVYIYIYSIWLVVWNHGILWLSIQLGSSIHPQLTHIFQRGRYTTNQYIYLGKL